MSSLSSISLSYTGSLRTLSDEKWTGFEMMLPSTMEKYTDDDIC